MVSIVLIMGVGLYLGRMISGIVHNMALANHVRGAEALSKGTFGIMVVFSGIMALRLLGIEIGILFDSMQIIIAAVGLGCALAFGISFGMAGKEAAARWIHDLSPRHDVKRENRPIKLKIRKRMRAA